MVHSQVRRVFSTVIYLGGRCLRIWRGKKEGIENLVLRGVKLMFFDVEPS